MITDLLRRVAGRLTAVDGMIAAHLEDRRRHGGSSRRSSGRRPGRSGDAGFVLLETVVAISLIAVVMAAFTTFFVNSVAFTSQQRGAQIATLVANSVVDSIRALPTSDLLNGRDTSSVTTQFNAASSTVAPWLTSMVAATDPTAATGSGATAAVPTIAVAQTLNNVVYSDNVYLGTCTIPSGAAINASCVTGAVSSGIQYLRAVVAVTWTGARCPAAGCSYVTATLLSAVDDPLFNQNQSPPAAPVLANPGPQTPAVGDTVSLAATITAVPTYSVAITAGTLPAGLILTPATGLISGTPTAVTATTAVTLTVTDGFGRATAATFNWTVGAALAGTAPSAQAGVVGTAITALTVSATGGTVPYTWSDPGSTLPPGLSLSTVSNQARITGTPTTFGSFPVTLKVTDSKSRTSTVSFTWSIDYPPFSATNPGSQTSTVGVADSVTLSVTGGSGSFAWTGGASLPAGLTLTAAGAISGVPTAAGTTSVTLVATDSKTSTARSVAFSWTVYARPTVSSPGNQSVTVGLQVSLQLTTTCPNAPCVYTFNNGPATFSISSSGVITGTVTSAAQTFSNVTVTVTDNSGAAVPSSSFLVVVNAAPSIASPGNQTSPVGTADSLDVSSLVSGGTAPLTYSAANLPSWLALDTSTGLITGTAPATISTTTGITLTVADLYGFSATSASFSWIVSASAPSTPLTVAVANGDTAVTASWTAPASTNGAAVTGYKATLSPGGASCTTTGALTCVIGGLTDGDHYSLTVTATNSAGTSPASAAVIAIPYPAGVMSAANGMTLWLDGADPNVLFTGTTCTGAVATSASTIGCWKDKSTQAENFTQATAANQPGVAAWNGLPAANFADTTDVLNSINATDSYQTAFVAANVTNPVASPYNIIDLFGVATQDFDVRMGSNFPRNTPNSNDWSYNTGTPSLNWTDGAQAVAAANPTALITSDQAQQVYQFSASVSNTFMNRGVVGQVGDVITFKTVLSTAQRRAVEEYLSNKWGVAITPGAPTAVTGVVATTTSATISWVAPTVTGGAAVSGYTVTSSAGQTCTTTGALSCKVTGLTHNTSYTFTVTANNAVGTGPASVASATVKP